MKALVIGVDSASPVLIQKWMDELPNLRAIFDSGAHGVLKSIVPPESVPAWQCFATGKNPAKIGVYGFTYIGRDRQLKFGKTTPELGCFWDICSQRGMKVGVFNVPGTYPPYPVNGFMVSGFPVPPHGVWSYPDDLMKRLDSSVSGYEIDVPLTKPTSMKGGEKTYLLQVQKLHDKTLQAAKQLIEWYEPDVFTMTFQAIDQVHHDFWKYMDNQDSPYANVLRDWYIKMDAAIGELRELSGPLTNVLVLSDHGSAPVSSALFINKYLESNGLLTVKGPVKRKGENYVKLRNWVLKTLPPSAIATIYKMTPEFIGYRFTESAAIERTLQSLVDNIDWDKTLAFSTGGHQAHIYVTYDLVDKLKGGEGSQTKTSVVEKLCNLMSELTDPKSGEKISPIFHFKEDTFKGPFQNEAPDLCVELYTKNEKVQVNPRLGAKQLWSSSPHFSSIHTREGFYGITGLNIRHGVKLDANLLDLAPTLLRLLNVETEADFDGRVLDQVIAN
ncbi:MAG TPA: alkaline phosphatase family protein [Candidatus Bathyarchaeia archaeon]|nr:alkaline phosphatase family protein [Candidatus Bathyarchaeia archaeon]